MKKIIKILRQRRGETLVEVICAFALFLLALGALHGGVRFAHSAMTKAECLRSEAAELGEGIAEASAEKVGEKTYTFYLAGPDGEAAPQEAFRVTVGLGEKRVPGKEGEERKFSLFLPLEEPP